MTQLNLRALLLCAIVLGGCAAPVPPPLKFVAVTMPTEIPAAVVTDEQHTLESSRMGVMYRPPRDLVAWLRELERAQEATVLRNVDVRLQVPFCHYVICYGTDTASAAVVTPAPGPVLAVAPMPPHREAGKDVRLAPRASPALEPGPYRTRGAAMLFNRPTPSGEVLEHLEAGATVEVTEIMTNSSGTWCFVRVAQKAGWLMVDSLDVAGLLQG